MPTIENPTGRNIGNLAMGGACAVLIVIGFGAVNFDLAGEGAAALGTVLGGLFQRFNLFG